MTQKIIQIGNSTGVIIPKSLLDLLGLKTGTEVKLEVDKATNSLVIQNRTSAVTNSSITTHFLKILDKVNNQYGPALRQLAQK